MKQVEMIGKQAVLAIKVSSQGHFYESENVRSAR